MTIVCATHFSDSSSDATEAAAAMARRADERLVLATVVPAARPPNGEGARLDEFVTALRWDGGRVEGRVLRGALGEVVRGLCDEVSASLLVVGRSEGQRHLFGAGIDVLAAGAAVPLLVVRDLRPFTRWGDAPLRVLLAVDARTRPTAAAERLTHLSTFGELEVLAAHVWSPEHDAQAPRDGAAQAWSNDALTGRPQHAVVAPGVSDAFVRLAVKEQVDLIVLGGLPGLLTAVSHEVLLGTATSILFVPAGDVSSRADLNPSVKEVSS